MSVTTEKTEEQYRRWLATVFEPKHGDDPRSHPPTFEQWKEGKVGPFISVTGQFYGYEGRERDYTIETWRMLMLPWGERGDQVLADLKSGATRTAWIWSNSPGTAKTGYAISAAREMAQAGYFGQIVRFSRIATLAMPERQALIEKMSERRLVVIDDIHRFRFSQDYLADWFHSFMDVIYNRNMKVIITANASFESVIKLAGKDFSAAFDRLREGGMQEIAAIGSSVRG